MNEPQYPTYPGPDEPLGHAVGQQPPYGQQFPPVYGHPGHPQPHGQPGHGYPGHAPLPPDRSSTKAMWAMITGIVSVGLCYGGLLIAPVAIVLALVAKKEIRASSPPKTGDGMATAGLVTGIVAIAIWAPAIALRALGAFI